MVSAAMDSFSDRMSSEVQHRLVVLSCPTDIVRFSFIVQNSICPLDLPGHVLLHPRFYDSIHRFHINPVIGCPAVKYPKSIINTEEKCRKVLSTTRDFLYRLHLDLPRKRELSLKDGSEPENMSRNCFRRHIGKIAIHRDFHYMVLACHVKEALKRSDNKLKLIKWLITFSAVEEGAQLSHQYVDYIAQYMYPELTESAFFKVFFTRFNFKVWIFSSETTEILEYFLFHLRKNRTTVNDDRYEMIQMSIRNLHFFKISSILKFQDAPLVPKRDDVWIDYTHSFERQGGPSRRVLFESEQGMSSRRFYLLVQLLFIFYNNATPYASEALRLLWKSLPDAFFSIEEIKMILQAGLSSETISDLYNFYSGVVGVYHEFVEPRSLKDLSRPTVRRMLCDSGCWIPDGIKLIGVPGTLQSFLNLDS